MTDPKTVPHRFQRIPVRNLRVEVVEGPNQGLTKTATGESLTIGTASNNDVVVTDPTVSRYHAELTCRGDEIVLINPGSTNGIMVGGLRIERGAIAAGTVLRMGKSAVRVEEGEGVEVDLHETQSLGGVRGKTATMRRLMAKVERAAQSESSVLLVGESGTGKGIIAQALHESSGRAKGPFLTVDCAAMSPTLVASELFGHERGAFTGADSQHIGAFERAAGGTLFLDELGELAAELQPVLLGVLERRHFRRLGGNAELPSDVRIVAATNRDLRGDVNAGKFRLDLYFRIAVLTIQVPALREHRDDIPILAEHFFRELDPVGALGTLIPPDAMQRLLDHRWPGNVRELRNFIEATVALGEMATIEDVHAPTSPVETGELLGKSFEGLKDLSYRKARQNVLGEFEARYFKHLLEKTAGNVTAAARVAEMDRSHLFELLRRHKLR